ncbi:hypothetical protein CC78DRAFT_538885 [Lojkania enalia]|uniref:Xylanolytic transcriptional activator regulatory domain-containing protein n=1 Tax=Lojkania enalia TaxID=147567 RepID=A0A9P4NBT3_9PLEO|nr:hypothetical protein CC78DRAFT_538885 [Didymosphaeria enalia]
MLPRVDERHIARHRQKDEEAGAVGCGILNTRKRMWKDADGNIVAKKPALSQDASQPTPQDVGQDALEIPPLPEFVSFQPQEDGAPISPPISHGHSLSHSTLDDHDSGIASSFSISLDTIGLSNSDSRSPLTEQRFWSSNLPQSEPFPQSVFDDAPFDDIFNPDTANSFNNPFTTMSNYNWLFDMDLSRTHDMQSTSMMSDPFPTFPFESNPATQISHPLELQFDRLTTTNLDKVSIAVHQGSLPSHKTGSPQQTSPVPLITPLVTKEEMQSNRKSPMWEQSSRENMDGMPRLSSTSNPQTPLDIERPLSMLQPSRSLPIIDELARQQLLDLIDIARPFAPDGSLVSRDHPLLSLSCLQTYCDLFFTRFNTAYPLIHMSTFDPSHVDTLLLTSVLLLGATYGEKDAHQLAVCIHDVLRPQIFANAGFSAKPDLWVLQTILLVECFGKSRAGQKQHDMSHLFHGLLINLIRRSDCQTIRPPTLEDTTDDLEIDWRTWVDAEQKKRLAFLCFMWDTQHAVLFCQSLCMSAFELRSTLPCDQALWEADSAESWHQLRQNRLESPLFLSYLKMYLNTGNPAAASPPKNLNSLSRTLLFHGLMSIAWDMQRRDQTSLGVIDSNPLGNWQARLATSYKAWYADYAIFCNQYLASLPSPTYSLAKEFHYYRTAIVALYHSAHILLHTPFLDLQIYAGARHILGRPVARQDYARSQRVVKKWVGENLKEAGRAVWHAAALIDQGVIALDGESGSDIGGGRLWHLPWSLYLGTLVVWGVWYMRPAQPTPSNSNIELMMEDEDEIIWDPQNEMKNLLELILKSEPEGWLEGGIAGGGRKRGMNGLAAVVSRCLSKIRWAVVHDGMMVLKGLVCWRLVGGGGGNSMF